MALWDMWLDGPHPRPLPDAGRGAYVMKSRAGQASAVSHTLFVTRNWFVCKWQFESKPLSERGKEG